MHFEKEDLQEEGKERQKNKKKENAVLSRALIILAWENSKPQITASLPYFYFQTEQYFSYVPQGPCSLDKDSIVVTHICCLLSSHGLAEVSSSWAVRAKGLLPDQLDGSHEAWPHLWLCGFC